MSSIPRFPSASSSAAAPGADALLGLEGLRQYWPLALRLIVGYGFFIHGWAKFSRGPEGFAHVLEVLGVPLPLLFSWITLLTEMIGGIAILAGAFVTLAALPMAVVLLVALAKVHLPYGFFSVKLAEVTAAGIKFGPVGYEHVLLYLAGLVALALGGAGPLSIDAWRARRRAG
ncbi:MAG TPA: DoxX family protein [Burkholderiales bacterium]|nr:DoxX family protein [Burkholderiales bacterium]